MHSHKTTLLRVIALLFITLLTGCATGALDKERPSSQEVDNLLLIKQENVSVDQYLMDAFTLIDTSWAPLFEEQGFDKPEVIPYVIMPGDSFETTCSDIVEADTLNVLICPDGANVYSLWMPSLTFLDIWNSMAFGQTIATEDGFAATTIIAHEYGHAVVDSVGNQLTEAGEDVPGITGKNTELIADCLAGVWMSAYGQVEEISKVQLAAAKEITRAAGDDAVIASEVPGAGEDVPHGTSKERVDALEIGYASDANPQQCIDVFWQ